MHCKLERDRLQFDLQTEESEGCSEPVEVIAPFVVVPGSPGELSGCECGDPDDRARFALLRTTIRLLRSSRSKLFKGDT